VRHMGRTRRIGQARLLALLAVLLGLLAMHGLASTHHPVAAPTTAAAGPVAPAPSQHGHHAPAATAADITSGGAQVLPVPSCHDECPNVVALLCVGILTSGLAAAALARRRTLQQLRDLPPVRARAPAGARAFGSRPDPVAELCVSRT
jgi:hypothetical protein